MIVGVLEIELHEKETSKHNVPLPTSAVLGQNEKREASDIFAWREVAAHLVSTSFLESSEGMRSKRNTTHKSMCILSLSVLSTMVFISYFKIYVEKVVFMFALITIIFTKS